MAMVPTRARKHVATGFVRPCSKCQRYTKHKDRVQHAQQCDGHSESIGPGRRPARDRGHECRPACDKRAIDGQWLARSHCPSMTTRSRTVEDPRSWLARGVNKLGLYSTANFNRNAEGDTRRLLSKLDHGHRGSVGIPVKKDSARPENAVAVARQLQLEQRREELTKESIPVPAGMSLAQYKRVVQKVCTSPNICTLFIGGARALESAIALKPALKFLVQHVATSHLVNLNVGEYEGCDFAPLLEALQHPNCIVGHLFVELDPTQDADKELKRSMQAALRRNRLKPRHKLQFARHFAVAKLGGHAWWDANNDRLGVHRRTAGMLGITIDDYNYDDNDWSHLGIDDNDWSPVRIPIPPLPRPPLSLPI